MIKKILITGGAGFVGSHLSEQIFAKFKKSQIIIIDKLSYAGNKKFLKNITNFKRVLFLKFDICNFGKMLKLTKGVDLAINVAAESHVDRSFNNSFNFTKTNTYGAHVFFEACKINKVKKIIQISTDEVYGEIKKGIHSEKDILNPTNPYAGSKAAAEMILNSYNSSFKTKIITVRGNNLYGNRQYPEKIIPHTISSILKKKKINIHGDGKQKRCFLHIDDFVQGILLLIRKGKGGEVYNIGHTKEYMIIDLVKKILKEKNIDFKKHIRFIKDRPFNDCRYYISSKKINSLGWKPQKKLTIEISNLFKWYKKNLFIFKE
jgi:dTDP-glucose 4,6-dehydratase